MKVNKLLLAGALVIASGVAFADAVMSVRLQ
jgi:hypothetical protein